MSALRDVAGKSLGGMRRRRCAAGDQHPTVSPHPVGEWVTEPAGQVVARRYRLRSLLGRGGMARVWLADDEVLHRPVALKQVLLNDPKPAKTQVAAWALALEEARAAARVDHVGVVKIHDIVEEDRRPWIVMELLSGRMLHEEVNAAGPLPVHQVTSRPVPSRRAARDAPGAPRAPRRQAGQRAPLRWQAGGPDRLRHRVQH